MPCDSRKITELDEDNMATVDILGVTRSISIDLTPQATVGDYVLVHAGFAIEVVSEQAANETLGPYSPIPRIRRRRNPRPRCRWRPWLTKTVSKTPCLHTGSSKASKPSRPSMRPLWKYAERTPSPLLETAFACSCPKAAALQAVRLPRMRDEQPRHRYGYRASLAFRTRSSPPSET